MYELPPILVGTPQEQLRAIRDYLVRVAQTLDQRGVSTGTDNSGDIERLARSQQTLRSMIERNDKRIQKQIEQINQQAQDIEALEAYVTFLQTRIPNPDAGAALGKAQSTSSTLELANGWTLTLNTPAGTSVSLTASDLTALLALLN